MKNDLSDKFDFIIKILEILIIPLVLGILAWTANIASNRIAESQRDLAQAQYELNEKLSLIEQKRRQSEVDARLTDLFGKYYFGDNEGQKRFAIKVIREISGSDLKNALATILAEDLKPEEEELKEKLIEITSELPEPKDWRKIPPKAAWVYQEDRKKTGAQQYSIHFHWSKERCERAKGNPGKWLKTECSYVEEIDKLDLNLRSGGWMRSWYQFKESPFPPPLPQI